MGSGHTHRKGRGNQRRPRNDLPRSQGGSGQNGHTEIAGRPPGWPPSTVAAAPSPTGQAPGNPAHAPRAAPQGQPPASAPGAPAPAPRDVSSGAARGPAADLPPAPQHVETHAAPTPAPSARPPFEPRHHVPGARPASPYRSQPSSEPEHEARNGHAREAAAPSVDSGRRSGPPAPLGEPQAHESRPITQYAAYAQTESFVVTERGERAAGQPDVRGDVGSLIDALKELFQQDRATASTGGATRCGICYLHYPLSELVYREAEGFYVCPRCAQAVSAARIPMVRRQKRL